MSLSAVQIYDFHIFLTIMALVRQDLQTKVTDAFVHLNTRAPIARKETVGKKAFSFGEILL